MLRANEAHTGHTGWRRRGFFRAESWRYCGKTPRALSTADGLHSGEPISHSAVSDLLAEGAQQALPPRSAKSALLRFANLIQSRSNGVFGNVKTALAEFVEQRAKLVHEA